ncbi:hypothetical protein HZS_6368 [Henneguya salminicola]|nr:hypothetical protein HZS_6368 [Henneguya salminicola]
MLMKYIWMTRTITTDFEKALISAVKQEFAESRILGCYFHLKQALQRKLKKKLNFSQSSPHTRFLLLSNIKSLLIHKDAVDNFWLYFERACLVRFPTIAWNSSEIPQLNIENRTNNALERYKKRLNDFFS